MSNLSNLLNPAPGTSQDNHSEIFHPVISPGLDALAAAASNTLPLFSPTQEQPSPNLIEQTHDGVKVPGVQPDHYVSKRDQAMNENTRNPIQPFLSPYESATLGGQDSVMEDSSPSFHTPLDISNSNQIPQSLSSNPPHLQEIHLPSQTGQIYIKAEVRDTSDAEMKQASSPQILPTTHVQSDPMAGTPLKTVMSNIPAGQDSQNGDTSTTPQKPKAGPPRKRAAPKKGTAVKPTTKKRKIETGSGKASPRTGTPATSRASGTPVPKKTKQESATPTRSSSVGNPEDDEDDGELELFCICRKPDDHTVMIGCDGPCEDWFHTRCVNMNDEKVALISKWYCPNCAAEGHETEWKRMCRLDGCSKPARIDGSQRSKYCCNEHGQEFINLLLSSHEKKAGTTNNNKRRKRDEKRDEHLEHVESEVEEPEAQDDNRGGILRPGELKALVDGVKDVISFRDLGNGVLSPPETVATSPVGDKEAKIPYSSEERSALDSITEKRNQIELHKQMLDDRSTLVQLVDIRRKSVLAKLKEKEKSLKDVCGYDARLSWSDQELNGWRTSEEGKGQLQTYVLNADPRLVETERQKVEDGEDAEIGVGVCKRKRCERHRTWFKIQQADLAMEKDEARQKLRKLDEEEKGIKERAMIRSLEEAQTGASEA